MPHRAIWPRLICGARRACAQHMARRRFQRQVAIRARCAAVENSENPGVAVDIKRLQPRTSRGCRDFSMIEFATHPQRPLRYRNPRRAKKMTQYTLSNLLQPRLQGLFSIRACGLGRQNLEQGKKPFQILFGGIGEKNCQTQYGRQARPKGI